MHQRVLFVALVAIACNGTPARGQEQQRSDDALRVPPGFKVGVFAEHLQGVRYMTLGPGNAIYASQPGSGLIVKLTDANRDGVADSVVTTVASGLKGPFGIAFRGDTMYVGAESELVRFDPGARDPVKLMGLPGGGHSTRTIVFGPDGKLYGALGAARARVLHGRTVPARVSRRRVRHAPRLVESLRTDGSQGRARRGRQRRASRGGRGGFYRRVAARGRQALGPACRASRITGWFTTRQRRLGWKNLEGELWAVK